MFLIKVDEVLSNMWLIAIKYQYMIPSFYMINYKLLEVLNLFHCQLVINKSSIWSSLKDVTVYIIVEVFSKVICAFKSNYYKKVISWHTNTLYWSDKLFIIRIINIDLVNAR